MRQEGPKYDLGESTIEVFYKLEGIVNDEIFVTYQQREGTKLTSWSKKKTNNIDISMIALQDGDVS